MSWRSIKRTFRKITDPILKPTFQAITKTLDGITTIIDNVASDPKKLAVLAVSVAFPQAASWIGSQVGLSGAAATIAGNTVLNSVANGGNVGEAFKGALISAGAAELTNTLKVQYASENISKVLTDIAAKTTTDVALATILGKDPVAALTFGGVQAATQVISDTVFKSIGLKDAYDNLPSVAKDSINAAMSASLTGKDITAATANAIVNSGIRALSNGIALQSAAMKTDRGLFTPQKLAELSQLPNINENTAQTFIEGISKAEDILGYTVPTSYESKLADNLYRFNDKNQLDENDVLSLIANSQYKDQTGQDTYVKFDRTEDRPGVMYGDDAIYYQLKQDLPAKKAGWDNGVQKDYFENRFNKLQSSDVSNVLNDLAGITSGLSDSDRQFIVGQIAGDDGVIDKSEAEKLKQILPAVDQENLSQLSLDDRFDDIKNISDLIKTWDTSKSANENLQSIVAAPTPEPSPLDVLGQPIAEQKPITTQEILDVIQPVPTSVPELTPSLSAIEEGWRDVGEKDVAQAFGFETPESWRNYRLEQNNSYARDRGFPDYETGQKYNWNQAAYLKEIAPAPKPSALDVLGQPITPEAVTVEPKPTTVEEVIELIKPQPEVVSSTPEPSQVTEPVTQPPAEVVTIPDGNGNQLVIDQTGNIVDIISESPSEVVEPVVPTPEVITLPPDEDGNQFVIDQEGNVVDIIPPEQLPVDQEDTTVPPFQGPMGPTTEDVTKRYNEEFAKYLDYLQAGQPAPPDYNVQDLGITPENWESFNKNLLDMQNQGRLPSQWQMDSEGNYTFVSDDGSTLTINDQGEIVHFTEAPMGNLPGEVPAPTPAPAPAPTPGPAPAPTPGPAPAPAPAPTPGGPQVPTPGKPTAPAAQPSLGLLGLLPLLASQKQPEQPKPFYSPTVEYVDIEEPFQIAGLNRNQNTRPIDVSSGGYLDELLAQFERRN